MNDFVVPISPEQAREFFFESMLWGYVGDGVYVAGVPFPGWRTFKRYGESLRLVDSYHVTPNSDLSTGFTMIYWKDIPIWVMQYGGWYAQEAIPTLKKALEYNYVRRVFIGGRGPSEFRDGNYLYANLPLENLKEGGRNFQDFSVRETIEDLTTGAIVGEHKVNGLWLPKTT